MAFVCKLCSWKTDRKGSLTVHLTKRHNIIKENNNIVVDTNTNIQLINIDVQTKNNIIMESTDTKNTYNVDVPNTNNIILENTNTINTYNIDVPNTNNSINNIGDTKQNTQENTQEKNNIFVNNNINNNSQIELKMDILDRKINIILEIVREINASKMAEQINRKYGTRIF